VYPYLKLFSRTKERLPSTADQVLIKKDLGGYPSWSEAEYYATISLLRAGWSEMEIIDIFNECSPPHFSKKKNPEAWFKNYMLEKALSKIQNYQSKRMSVVEKLKNWAAFSPWPGRTGNSDKRVFIACAQKAELDGINNFRASEREISELAGVHRKTARNAIRRLVQDQYLKKVPSNDLAFHYSFIQEKIQPIITRN